MSRYVDDLTIGDIGKPIRVTTADGGTTVTGTLWSIRAEADRIPTPAFPGDQDQTPGRRNIMLAVGGVDTLHVSGDDHVDYL